MTPRQYLSFSQMTLFEMSPNKFIDKYLYGQKQRISRNIAYGKKMADGLERGEATGDPMLDLMMAKIPKFERMDEVIQDKKGEKVWYEVDKKFYKVPVLKDKKEEIPLLSKPDTANRNYSKFKEYKTSVRKWTQSMVDNSGQITFYATAIWLKTGKIPTDIELVNVEVAYQNGGHLAPTSNIFTFKTERTMVDIIKMTGRIKSAWRGIKELYNKELF
jgi:hypothetical protein